MQKLIEMKNKKGFTLIEMLIVILIIVILLAIAVPAVAGYRKDALRTQDEGAIETIRTAIESAVIRSLPEDTVSGSEVAHSSGNLDYDEIVRLSTDTSLTAETREFYEALASYLGPNFQGGFRFKYDIYAWGGTVHNQHLDYVAYWRSDSQTSDESIMVYEYYFANSSAEFREPVYLSEIMEIYPEDPGNHADGRDYAHLRPRP